MGNVGGKEKAEGLIPLVPSKSKEKSRLTNNKPLVKKQELIISRVDLHVILVRLFSFWEMLPWLCLMLDAEGREMREVCVGAPPASRLAARLDDFMEKSSLPIAVPKTKCIRLDIVLENGAFLEIPDSTGSRNERVIFHQRPVPLPLREEDFSSHSPALFLYRKGLTGEVACDVGSIRVWEENGFLFVTWSWRPNTIGGAPLYLRVGRGKACGQLLRF